MAATTNRVNARTYQSVSMLVVRAALLAFVLVVPPNVCCAQTSLEIQVGSDNDDAEEDDGGSVSLNNDELELGQKQWIGFRFNAVTVPPGATINSAYVEMRSTDNNSESTDLTVFGENADDAATFSSGSNNLSSRPMTTAAVDWSNVEDWDKNQWHDTPDLSAIIQEIVDRGGWVDGNNLVILVRSDDLNGNRLAFSHDDNGTKAAKLHIEYTTASTGDWAFDEGSGTTVADSSSPANDATISGATWTSDCSGNTALEFDGLGDVATTDSTFTPPATGSVAFWMRGTGTPAALERLLGVSDDWEIRQDTTGKLLFDFGATPVVGNEPFATSTAVDEDGRWYHVVAQFDATDDSYEVYVDGELQASGISPVDLVAQSAAILSFGTRTGSSDDWNGALRDVRVGDSWLTSSEIATLSGTAGHWRFDETSGTTALDATVNANDGAYQNSPTLGVTSVYTPENGTAVLLDGVLEYVSIPHVDAMLADNGTVAFWFRAVDFSATQGLLSKDASGFGTGGHLTIQLIGGKVNATLESTTQAYTIESPVVAALKWKHMSLTWGTGGMILYIDGQEVASDLTYTGGLGTSSGGIGNLEPLVVAADASISGNLTDTPLQNYLSGSMDDIRFYTRTLCSEEVYRGYRGGRSPGVRIIKWIEVR